ncbi:MAG: adenylate/guanylate cyclase domain-containing protein [Patescibacteria group bacterium]|nr:adenylate/guanylate cyclase domain-containing protein [Patescibacteria group bacterium]
MKIKMKSGRALLVGGAVGLVAALAYLSGIFASWDNRLSDLLYLPHQVDPKIYIISIDDSSLTQIGRWPWPRSVHAELIDRLKEAGARVIAYDVNFPEPSDETDDQALAESVKAAGNVVLPIELQFLISRGQVTYAPEKAVSAIPQIGAAAAASGHVNSPPDTDNIFRRTSLVVRGPDGKIVPSFETQILDVIGKLSLSKEARVDSLGRMMVSFAGAPGNAYRQQTISAVDVLRGTRDLTPLNGSIVFVGATAYDLHDNLLVPTSFGLPMPGVEVHANILDTLLNRRWISEFPSSAQAAVLVLLGFLVGFLVWKLRAKWNLPLTVLLWIIVLVASLILFDRGWIYGILWPTVVMLLSYAAVTLERKISAEREKKHLKQAFSQYVSSAVVDSILADPSRLKLGGERKRMSVLFSDICGFTSISEGLSPEKLVELLNKYLNRMTEIVFEERGVLDKYIGDAVMAFWNAPLEQPHHAEQAVRTALKMQRVLDKMNEDKDFGDVEIRIGVGINTGDMVVGNVGGDMRFDYTVIGDNVNLGSRLEALTRQYKVGVITTEATRQELGEHILCRRLDKVAVKGKKEPVVIYEAMVEEHDATDGQKKLAHDFEDALEKYFARDFTAAKASCDAILSVSPEDFPTKNLKERCDHFLQEPPPSDWVGTWVYTKK